ncbi:MAG TPA: DUF5683 domain-containing protein [Ignavibacteria bacterium]|nr:DUF5683 domain-containing protein [Ignavibacteria bacterium]HQY52032.1 DUF5683 domain-containing protein [Ignavibacteria bacterium]HRA99560.1 DUF5683 domain-containing protein [Ignavibacteria bacterium]
MKIFHSAIFVLFGVIFLFINRADAQIKTDKISFYDLKEKVISKNDTLKSNQETKQLFIMKKQPWRAVAYSAILPGAGQFYSESYWKVPIILGLGGYFVYGIINNNNQYIDYRDQYQNSQTTENPNGNQQLLNLREFYRDQRDNFYIYSAILYLANLIDAYVDAQLYDFNVSDKINFGLLKKNRLIGIEYNF